MEKENMIYVPLETFQELCESKGRVYAFVEWLKKEGSCYISKYDCAAILGFEIPAEGNE